MQINIIIYFQMSLFLNDNKKNVIQRVPEWILQGTKLHRTETYIGSATGLVLMNILTSPDFNQKSNFSKDSNGKE